MSVRVRVRRVLPWPRARRLPLAGMATALFSFDDRASGQRAASRLAALGVRPEAVVLHLGAPRAGDAIGSETDELLTGGFVGNLNDLLQRLFEWGEPAAPEETWRELERRGGSVVEVRADSESERTRIDDLMQSLGATRRMDWRETARG